MAPFALPALPYQPDALEPYIDKQTVDLADVGGGCGKWLGVLDKHDARRDDAAAVHPPA